MEIAAEAAAPALPIRRKKNRNNGFFDVLPGNSGSKGSGLCHKPELLALGKPRDSRVVLQELWRCMQIFILCYRTKCVGLARLNPFV